MPERQPAQEVQRRQIDHRVRTDLRVERVDARAAPPHALADELGQEPAGGAGALGVGSEVLQQRVAHRARIDSGQSQGQDAPPASEKRTPVAFFSSPLISHTVQK